MCSVIRRAKQERKNHIFTKLAQTVTLPCGIPWCVLNESQRRHNAGVSPGISRLLQAIIGILLQIRPRPLILHHVQFILHCHHTTRMMSYVRTLIHSSLRPSRVTADSAANIREVVKAFEVHLSASAHSPLLGGCEHVKEPSIHIG